METVDKNPIDVGRTLAALTDLTADLTGADLNPDARADVGNALAGLVTSFVEGSDSFQLSEPVKRGSETIESLTFSALKARDMMDAEKKGYSETQRNAFYLQRSTGLSPKEVEELDFFDLTEAVAAMSNFLALRRSRALKKA